jgi:hypothetical protein
MSPQPTLFDPPRARATDPETSRRAARRARDHAQPTRVIVLRLLVEMGPLTDQGMEQLARQRKLACSPSGLRSRRVELKRKGLVRSTGRFGRVTSGGEAEIWDITPGGKAELRAIEGTN